MGTVYSIIWQDSCVFFVYTGSAGLMYGCVGIYFVRLTCNECTNWFSELWWLVASVKLRDRNPIIEIIWKRYVGRQSFQLAFCDTSMERPKRVFSRIESLYQFWPIIMHWLSTLIIWKYVSSMGTLYRNSVSMTVQKYMWRPPLLLPEIVKHAYDSQSLPVSLAQIKWFTCPTSKSLLPFRALRNITDKMPLFEYCHRFWNWVSSCFWEKE